MNKKEFFDYWKRLLPHQDAEAFDFLIQKGSIKQFKKDEVIKLANEAHPLFYVVLEGFVGGFQLNEKEELILNELILPKDYFTGTKHPFSGSPNKREFRALTNTQIFQLNNLHIQEGQRRFADLSELFHILKQRKINFLSAHLTILQEQNISKRYHRFRKLMPILAIELPSYIQCFFLHTSPAHLRRIKKIWLTK